MGSSFKNGSLISALSVSPVKYVIAALLVFLLSSLDVKPRSKKLDERAAKSPPNVLLILVDDLGYGDLSIQGAKDMRTPNIDNLANAGLKLTNFYANSTVCSPSRASLLTGQYPDLVGVPGVIRQFENENWGYLKHDATLLPKTLKSSGYETAMIGKWHLGLEAPNLPNDRGFDFFKGFLADMMDDYYTHLRGGVNWILSHK